MCIRDRRQRELAQGLRVDKETGDGEGSEREAVGGVEVLQTDSVARDEVQRHRGHDARLLRDAAGLPVQRQGA